MLFAFCNIECIFMRKRYESAIYYLQRSVIVMYVCLAMNGYECGMYAGIMYVMIMYVMIMHVWLWRMRLSFALLNVLQSTRHECAICMSQN